MKWGGLIYLAKSFGISRIVYISYFRGGDAPDLEVDGTSAPIPKEVWEHFSSLKNIEPLAAKVQIDVSEVGCQYDCTNRTEYREEVVKELQNTTRPLIAFCDPDTGLAPGRSDAEHTSVEDLQGFWAALGNGDILAVYQHAQRVGDWLRMQRELMAKTLDTEVMTITAPDIARDVALLWSRRQDGG